MYALKLFKSFTLLALLISCGGNSKLFEGTSVSSGASQTGNSTDLSGGGTVSPPGGGVTTDVKICRHPEALDFDEQTSGEPGACSFEACTNTGFLESNKVADYQLYIDQYGGTITSNPNLCKTEVCDASLCQHPDAENFHEYGKCNFLACGNDTFYEHYLFLGYQSYVAIHGGTVEHRDEKCVNQQEILGCTVGSATNDIAGANTDNGTCTWSACLDPKYEEYEEAGNKIVRDDIASYVGLFGGSAADYVSASTCSKLIVVPGCLDPLADNPSVGCNHDNLSCKYSYCADPAFVEFDDPASKAKLQAAKVYADQYGLNLSDVSINTCKTPKPKCTDPRATNTNEYKVCHYSLCNQSNYEEYSLYEEIFPLAQAGQATFVVNNDKECKTIKQVPGCLETTAIETTAGATYDNGSCKWKEACLDNNFQEYFGSANQSLIEIINNYASTHGLNSSSLIGSSTCSTPVAVPGCTVAGAEGYNPQATEDNGSCKFSLCADRKYGEWDKAANKALIETATNYAQLHAVTFSDVVGTLTCSQLCGPGCLNPLATNYEANAGSEKKNCKFQACINCGSGGYGSVTPPEYSSDIEDIIHGYSTMYGVNPPIVSTCNKNIYTLRVKFDGSCLTKTQVAKVKVTFTNTGNVFEDYLTTSQPELKTYHTYNNSPYTIEVLSYGYLVDGQQAISESLQGHTIKTITCE